MAVHALLTQLGRAQAGSQARLGYKAEIITKAGNRSALSGFNTLSREPAGFQTAAGFNPVLKCTRAACSTPMNLSLVHKIKAIQGSAGTAPTDTSRSSPKGFTSLSMSGLRYMNRAERGPNNSNQTVTMESLG